MSLLRPVAAAAARGAMRVALVVGLALAGAAVALIALGFFCAALFLEFRTLLPPPAAAAATGGCAIVLALAALGVARLAAGGGRDAPAAPKAASAAATAGSQAFNVGSTLGGLLGREAERITHSPGRSILAAILIGFAVGVSPRLRRALSQILK